MLPVNNLQKIFKMKFNKITSIFSVAIAAAILSSCAFSTPMLATNNKPVKTGKATAKVIFGFPPMNMDLSIKTAAKNGGINKVATVDFLVESKALGFIQQYTTIVTGE